MYPHHISHVKSIDQIGNGGGKCRWCRLKRRALARQTNTVRNQVRTIQSIFPQPQANIKPFSPKITPKSCLCAYCKPSVSHTTMGVSRHQAVGERAWKICLSWGLRGFLAVLQSSEYHVQKLHCLFLTSPRETGSQALWSTQSKMIYFWLGVSGSFLFQNYQSTWVDSTEHCKVLASSHPCKLEFYFAKIGLNIYSNLFYGTKVPLLIMSPNKASIQREDVLEYPLFLDEYRAFPICYLSVDTSPSLVSTCSQPPFIIWKWQWLPHVKLKSNE